MGVSLAVGVLIDPWFGLVAAGVSIGLILRPFEPITALAVLAGAASFVNNEGGHMTRDLSVVALLGAYAMLPLLLARMQGQWRAPGGRFMLTVLAFLLWTAFATVRGVLLGNSVKFIGLEVASLGTMTYTWLAGGLRITTRDLRPGLVVLMVTGVGHVVLGLVSYAVNHIRTGGVWYTPYAGMMAVLAFCFALRARSLTTRTGWTLLMSLFLLHQIISFSRGYWLGLLGALPWTAFTYAGYGSGAWIRWRRLMGVISPALGLAAICVVITAVALGWSNLPALVGTRFGSSFSTKYSAASASNIERLLEYPATFRHIADQPLIGYGMGYTLHIREPFHHVVTKQPFVHETYLWLWLKQGVVGVVLLLAMLVLAIRTGLKGARSSDDEQAAWCLGTAGATLYLAIVDLTTFHLANINSTMLQSLLWGFIIALSRPVHLRLLWKRPATQPVPHVLTPG